MAPSGVLLFMLILNLTIVVAVRFGCKFLIYDNGAAENDFKVK